MWKWIGSLLGKSEKSKPVKIKPQEVIKAVESQLAWIAEGLKLKGYHEVKNNSLLRTWLRSDGKTLGDPSKFPWCGDFVETALKLGVPGLQLSAKLKENPYWARNWATFGVNASHMPYGAVVVFERGSGGHVGFAVGRSSDSKLIYVLGGNQSDTVSIAPIKAERLIAVRWPAEVQMGKKKLPVMGGGAISVNEQ
jgi:uncharacterized protein (TIGR02594 family)